MSINPFFQQDILSSDQFNQESLEYLLDTAAYMEQHYQRKEIQMLLSGTITTALFYEPSSRTFGSFIAAAQRLGGGFIPIQGVTYSSVAKGETLPDTVRTFGSYSDVIVVRHPEVGAAKIAAEFCDKPVVNAGDGVGEHPTQAALDFYTIRKSFSGVEGLTITLLGDLLNGRTIHSLLKLMAFYKNINVNLISPESLSLPKELKNRASHANLHIHESENLDEVLESTDVLYVTRVQKERFTDLDAYERVKNAYIITTKTLKRMKKTSIIMHPFPRVGEISLEVDLDPRALYINGQMRNGLFVRMAVLYLVLRKESLI